MFLLWLRQLPRCGDQAPASVPPLSEGRSSPANTPVFPPAPPSCHVLWGSINSLPKVRFSYLFSAGVLHPLLCLKVYSWCVRGREMYSMSTSTILFSWLGLLKQTIWGKNLTKKMLQVISFWIMKQSLWNSGNFWFLNEYFVSGWVYL